MIFRTSNQKLKHIIEPYVENPTYDDIVCLVSEIYQTFKNNTVRIFQANARLLELVRIYTNFLDNIDGITLKTRLKYLLDDIKDIKICNICGKPITDNIQFLCQPMPVVHACCQILQRKLDLSYIDRQSNQYFKQNPILFNELYEMISENPRTFVMKLKSKCSRPEYKDYSYLTKWIDSSLPLLYDPKYDYTTKCRWIFEGRTDFPICPVCGRRDVFFNKRLKLNVGYTKYCSVKCQAMDPDYWDSVRSGCQRNHGVKYPLQCKEIIARKSSKYEFNNIKFDSSSEVITYLYFKDNIAADIIRNADSFNYEFYGQMHQYIPDFFIPSTNTYIEIKGKQFINDDGTMKQVWYKNNMTGEQRKKADAKEEARHQCMLAHNVKLIVDPSEEIKKMKAYVNSTYGKDFVRSLRTSKQ